jgi:hypothetical protein
MNDLPMAVMCINDANKPQEIPQDKWIKKGQIYTVIGVQMLLSSNALGFELAEIKLDESCFPYHYFNPNRFEPVDNKEIAELEAELQEILSTPVA